MKIFSFIPIRLGAYLLSSLILLASCHEQEVVIEPLKLDKQMQDKVLHIIDRNLHHEYMILTTHENLYKKEDILKNLEKEFVNDYQAKQDYIHTHNRKWKLDLDNFRYTSYTFSLNVKETTFKIKNDSVFVNVSISYSLPTNSVSIDDGKNIITEGTDYYQYSFVKINSDLRIASKEKSSDFPTRGSVSILEDVDIPFFRSDRASSIGGDNDNMFGSYNSTSSVAFAKKHYQTPPNTGYYDYSNFGGDCTNFVSHCLKAGNWGQVNNWFWKSNGSSCENMSTCQRSPSWTGAAKFYEFLTNSGSTRVNRKFTDVQVYYWYSMPETREAFKKATSVLIKGDIVQVSSNTDKKSVHHTTIVTEKDTEGKILVTYRNSTGNPNALNRYVGDFTGGEYLQ